MNRISLIALITLVGFASYGASQLQFQSPLKAVQHEVVLADPEMPNAELLAAIDEREALFARLSEGDR